MAKKTQAERLDLINELRAINGDPPVDQTRVDQLTEAQAERLDRLDDVDPTRGAWSVYPVGDPRRKMLGEPD